LNEDHAMKKAPTPKHGRKPVADVVHQILESAKIARTDGPASGLYGRDAQVSSALTQAGTTLAKLDRAVPAKRSSMLQNLWSAPAPSKPRRMWLFGSSKAAPAMPDAKRIEQLLRASAKDGRRLVLDRNLTDGRLATRDIDCTLPEGAVDPVCTPR
jgi:hypothetical protein